MNTNKKNKRRMRQYEDSRIAVIGMACRFPGANSISEYWHNLISGVNSISFFTDQELKKNHISEKLLCNPAYVKARGILQDVYCFDAEFFGISPYEAKMLDPQQRLFLELVWSALEGAGYAHSKHNYCIGVYAGMRSSTYLEHNLRYNKQFLASMNNYETTLSTSSSFLASRTSYLLNLKGPSININTACSTSLVTVVTAAKALVNGDCDLAIAGGISIVVPQETGYLYQEGSVFSPDGQCRTFDAKADGLVSSNGAGIVILKRLKDAIKDGDSIEAVLCGYAINNDGADKVGYTAPSISGQVNCINAALSMAQINPEEISYVEAHGSGSPLGDSIEVAALTKAFHQYTSKKNYCAIGSVKINIGHTDVASGIAGLIKAILSIKHGTIPPSLNFNIPNPNINFDVSPFYVNGTLVDWPKSNASRKAAVNSIGMGGTNAHVILEQAKACSVAKEEDTQYYLLPYSAKNKEAVLRAEEQLKLFFQDIACKGLKNIAYILQQKRTHFSYRNFVVANNSTIAIQNLRKNTSPVKTDIVDAKINSSLLCFLFSGQASQYPLMGKALYAKFEIFKQCIDDCAEKLRSYINCDLRDLLFPQKAECEQAVKKLQQTQYAQPAIFVIEYALTKLLMSFGVHPDVMIGHSIGEYAAAYFANIFSLKDALKLIAKRAHITSKLKSGSMLAVTLNVNKLKEILPSDLSIAAINAPGLCVVSGEKPTIENFRKKLGERDVSIITKLLPVSHAFHSHMMHAALEEFQKVLEDITFQPIQNTIISTTTGKKVSAVEMSCVDYWLKHLHNSVSFSDAIKEADQLGCKYYLEIGPGNALAQFVGLQNITRNNVFAYNTLPSSPDDASPLLRGASDGPLDTCQTFYTALGKLWQHGVTINWNIFWSKSCGKTIALPTYPFAKTEYVISPDREICHISPSSATMEDYNKNLGFYQPKWIVDHSQQTDVISTLAKETVWLLFLDKQGLGGELHTLLEKYKQTIISVHPGKAYLQKSKYEYVIRPNKREDYQQLFDAVKIGAMLPKYIVHLFSLSVEQAINHQVKQGTIQDYGFHSLINYAQIFQKDNSFKSEILVLSNQIKKIFPNDFVVPEKATILGPCMVIPQEYALHKVRFMDIDYTKDSIKAYASIVIEETIKPISITSNDAIIAYRKQQRFVQSFNEIFFDNEFTEGSICNTFKKDGVYLITGGLGQLGLYIAKYIATRARAKLVLLNRSSLPPKAEWNAYSYQKEGDKKTVSRIKKIEDIEKRGSAVYSYVADMSDPLACQKATHAIQKEVGLINGVIHTAGLTGHAALSPINTMDNRFIEKHLAAKINGIKYILDAIDDKNLDFCVLFSSSASFTGGDGYVAYTAANQCLDAFAWQASQNQSFNLVSINWDIWNTEESLQKDENRIPITPVVSIEDGLNALELILNGRATPEIVVSDRNWLMKMHYLQQFVHSAYNFTQEKENNEKLAKKQKTKPLDYEEQVSKVFKQCLGLEHIDPDADFYDLSGHSLLAVRLIVMLEKAIHLKIPLAALNQNRTVRKLAAWINQNDNSKLSPLVELKNGGTHNPLFIFHPVNGSISCYFELAKQLKYDGPIIGIQDSSLAQKGSFATFEAMASFYLSFIKEKQAKGPYFLAGASLGGNLAYEVAKQLNVQGERVAYLGLFDSWALFSELLRDRTHFKQVMQTRLANLKSSFIDGSVSLDEFLNLIWHRMELLYHYQPGSINTKVVLYKATNLEPEYQEIDDPFNHWGPYISELDLEYVLGDHVTMLNSPNVGNLAEKVSGHLMAVNEQIET